MARVNKPSGAGGWMEKLGEELGAELGGIIAQSIQRTLAAQLDVQELARRLELRGKGQRRGRPASALALSGCSEPGCTNPVLAKGLCRSHYYRARYEAQKSGKAPGRRASK